MQSTIRHWAFLAMAGLLALAPIACSRGPLPESVLAIQTGAGVEHRLTIELARTEEEHERGYKFRTEVPPGTGMLFVFPDDAERFFWMKDTKVPLDMIFIRADGMIRSVHAQAVPGDETPIGSGGPVRAVLEVGGGEALRMGLAPGDRVRHAVFGNALAE